MFTFLLINYFIAKRNETIMMYLGKSSVFTTCIKLFMELRKKYMTMIVFFLYSNKRAVKICHIIEVSLFVAVKR